jgi:hypothetical protein
MARSIYDRPSGRAASNPKPSFNDKAGHLSSSRDPFKPRQADLIFSLLTPAAVYGYCWKRAALPLSALQNFASLYMATWVMFAVCSVPWLMRIGGNVLEKPMGNIKEVFTVWPWYQYLRYAYFVPYVLQVLLAVKAWWLARSVTKLAVDRANAADPESGGHVPSADYDLSVQLFGLSERYPGTLIEDLTSIKLTAAELDFEEVVKPPGPSDVGGEEELEDSLFMTMPALVFVWFGPMRLFNLSLAAMCTVFYMLLAVILTLMLGWPLEYVFYWTETGKMPDSFMSVRDRFRGTFFDGLWVLLYSGGMSLFLGGLMFLCYSFYKRTGVAMQMRSVIPGR